MKKKSIKNFKKLENKDLKKIKGGGSHYVLVNGEWVLVG
ncbi:bacteriocin-like protein [Dysgonomonas alginatilytica]|uniref:Bacteriocin-like protein n=1 Tax=Dysgonomonas alginatilytica TaxID=1605892 RepID=A0A2V3PS06_9BACT|nr:ComC/BlpC family leader-containing pheromone/bacteriocin [Dysgonomonas alginatilytica]PXV67556.1 bacteriocin-like protein [Dysgonomonas alginatilytica]